MTEMTEITIAARQLFKNAEQIELLNNRQGIFQTPTTETGHTIKLEEHLDKGQLAHLQSLLFGPIAFVFNTKSINNSPIILAVITPSLECDVDLETQLEPNDGKTTITAVVSTHNIPNKDGHSVKIPVIKSVRDAEDKESPLRRRDSFFPEATLEVV